MQYISDIEQQIYKSILGTVGDPPCQWMCPYDANKKELCPITMDNVRTRRVIDSLDTMIDICVTDGVWKRCGQPHSTTAALQWCSYISETILPTKQLPLIRTMPISSTRHAVADGRRTSYKLPSYEEECVSLLTTRMGSDEFLDYDLFLPTYESRWWSYGCKQEVTIDTDSKMAPMTAYLPLQSS